MYDKIGQTRKCPDCNGVMVLLMTQDGALFVCGECRTEIPVVDVETVQE